MPAQVSDATDPGGGVGQGCDRDDDGCQLAGVVQVDVEPADLPVAGDGQARALEQHVGAHRVEDVADRVAGLGGVLRPPRDPHGAAGDNGRGQEGGGVGQVRLDLDVEGMDL